MIVEATGIILAGGKSSRMGGDKAFTLLSGRPLVEIVINKLSPLFKDLIIITNKPFLYKKYGLRTKDDILKDRGPLGGIYTGLLSSYNMYNFIVACDMPFINQDLTRYMLGKTDGYDATIAEYNGRLQPLSAVYSKGCMKLAKKLLSENNLKLTDFLKHLKIRIIDENEVRRFDAEGLSFTNINTKKDFQCLLQNHFAK